MLLNCNKLLGFGYCDSRIVRRFYFGSTSRMRANLLCIQMNELSFLLEKRQVE